MGAILLPAIAALLDIFALAILVKDAPEPENVVALTVPFTSNFCDGIALPIPTLPVSSTVTTCVEPSNNRTISAVPLCVTAIPASVLLFAPTSTLSTPIKFVSKVVVVPSTVKLLLTH